jgi:zinc protease
MTSNKFYSIKTCIFIFSLFPLLLNGCIGNTGKYKNLKYHELGEIKIPEIRQVTLDNGMQLFLLEDHELPLIQASALIRTGTAYEPADKISLASITAVVMRTGGTKNRTGDEIDIQLEQIAASVETGMGQNSGSASMSVLKEDINTGLSILADILMYPAFSEEKIELAKLQLSSSISRRNDEPFDIASREYRKLIYGAQSVYARHSEYATVDNITRDDLVEFHKKYYHPNNMMLALWGDFDTAAMIEKIKQVFKDWEKSGFKPDPMPQVEYNFRSSVNSIRKEDTKQSTILLGHVGGKMDDPDYFALTVMNEILGADFTGRLFQNVRSRLGLAYSAFGQYSSTYDHDGLFYVGCQTKSQSTVQAARAMIEEVKKITQSEVTDEELTLAKESYLNSFVFNFESKGQIVTRLMTYKYFGYPDDFLQKIQRSVEQVTKADVLRVAKQHLRPDAVQILVVGVPEDFDEPLSVFGAVRDIDITIPPAKKN